MVGKLIKHEALRTLPMVNLAWGIAIVVVLLAGGLAWLQVPGISLVAAMISLIVSAATPVAVNVLMAVDFWRTGWGKQGYFTHSIPVRGSTILTARIIWGSVVVIVTLILTMGLLLLALWLAGPLLQGDGASFEVLLSEFLASMGQVMPWWQWAIVVLLAFFLSWFYLMVFYFASTIGGAPRWAQLGNGGPVVVWVITYIVLQVLLAVSLFLPVGVTYVSGGWEVQLIDIAVLLKQENPTTIPLGLLVPLICGAVLFTVWMGRSWNRRISLR